MNDQAPRAKHRAELLMGLANQRWRAEQGTKMPEGADPPELEHGSAPDDRPRRMLNEKQVLAIIPVGRTTLWRMEKAGKFPKATYVSPNRRLWFEPDVLDWQREIDGRGRGWRTKRERAAATEANTTEAETCEQAGLSAKRQEARR